MDYMVYLLNLDGSASLIGKFSSQSAAEALANSQASGSQCRIEYGDEAQSSIIEYIEVP